MTFPFKNNNDENQRSQKARPAEWEFVPVDEAFPQWQNAREVLENIITAFSGVTVNQAPDNPGELAINFGFHNKINNPAGKDVLPFEMVPSEDLESVTQIIRSVFIDYTPDNLDRYRGTSIDAITIAKIKGEFKQAEDDIIAQGGRSLEDELRFRLGISLLT